MSLGRKPLLLEVVLALGFVMLLTPVTLPVVSHLGLPGLQYDEALGAAPAMRFLAGGGPAEPMQIGPSVIHPFGRPLPVMLMAYIGPIKPLAQLPWLAGTTPSPGTPAVMTREALVERTRRVRWMALGAVLANLALTAWLVRRLWGPVESFLAVVLLLLDPSWIFYLTRDAGPAVLAILLKLATLVLGLTWWRRGGLGWLGGAAFAAGLGISHKVDFLWWLVSLGIVLVLLAGRPRRLARWSPSAEDPPPSTALRAGGRQWTVGALGLLLGSAPVVTFNLATGGATFAPLVERLGQSGPGSVAALPASLLRRLGQIPELLSGEAVGRLFFYDPSLGGGRGAGAVSLLGALATFLILASALGLVLRGGGAWLAALRAERPTDAGRHLAGLGLVLIPAGVLLASTLSPTTLGSHHLLMLYPELWVMVAVALGSLWHRGEPVEAGEAVADPGGGRRPGPGRSAVRQGAVRGVVVALVAAVLAGQLMVGHRVHERLETTGGVGFWSDAIVPLARDLARRGEPVVLLDWGFTNNLIVLGGSRLALEPAYRELWRHPPSPELVDPYLRLGGLYLTHPPRFAKYRQMEDWLHERARLRGWHVTVEQRFHQRDGREVYRLLRVVRVPRDLDFLPLDFFAIEPVVASEP